MKKMLLTILLFIVCKASWSQLVVKTSNISIATIDNSMFGTKFNPTAKGKNTINAFLLCYLSTMIYPQYLLMHSNTAVPIETGSELVSLHKDTAIFMAKFKTKTKNLFLNPTYVFVNKTNANGYDPEAMVIATDRDVFVIFRGTDRVASNKEGTNEYELNEWVKTDFDFFQTSSPDLPTGVKVHQGMLNSLQEKNFSEELYNTIKNLGGHQKNVWITGHSLGGGQAQIFALLLKQRVSGITAKGLYTYASPNPGNLEFKQKMNQIFNDNNFQRFEFVDDPVTALTGVTGDYFKPAGKRVYFDDVNEPEQFGVIERDIFNTASCVGGAIMNLAKVKIKDALNIKIGSVIEIAPILNTSNFCYHHPTWYLRAAYNQLTSPEKNEMPAMLLSPTTKCEACDNATVNRGNSNNITENIINNGLALGKEIVDAGVELVHNIGNLLNSFTANQLDPNYEGFYKIKNLYSGRYLCVKGSCDGDNGCGFMQWDDVGDNGKFKIEQYEIGGLHFGYSIKLKGTNTVVDVDSWNSDKNIQLQTWSKNTVPTPNQAWGFYKIGNSGNKYIIQSKVSGKVMDLTHPHFENGRPIKQRGYSQNRLPQVWILEKVN
jgi:hypothetical protein